MAASDAVGIGGLWRRRVGDEELLARAQRGDEASFSELHRRFSPALFGYCLVRLRDHQAAEDAVQDTFLRAMNTQPTDIVNARAWLFALVRNAVIDAARRSQTLAQHVEPVEDIEGLACASSPQQGADTTGAIFLALRRLPARQRRALVLREFQDLSSSAIATEMNTSAANVDVLVTRARTAFGKTYGDLQQLPKPCRRATELIYRELGSGITDLQAEAMRSHVDSCPRCRSEYRRAHAKHRLQGLLPVPAFLSAGLQDAWFRAEALARSVALHLDQAILPHWSRAAKAGLGVALAAFALSPAALDYAPVLGPRTLESGLSAETLADGSEPKSFAVPRKEFAAPAASGELGDQGTHEATRLQESERLSESEPLRATHEGTAAGAAHGSGEGSASYGSREPKTSGGTQSGQGADDATAQPESQGSTPSGGGEHQWEGASLGDREVLEGGDGQEFRSQAYEVD